MFWAARTLPVVPVRELAIPGAHTDYLPRGLGNVSMRP